MILHLLFSIVVAIVTSQPLICSRLGNFYESNCPSQPERSDLIYRQGLPGKRGRIGQKGERGLQGNKGSAGEVDYDRVEEMISQKLTEGYCPVKYHRSCFWIAVRFNPPIIFDQAKSICAALGGKPANIYSEEHYNKIMEYLRTFIIKDDWMHAWLGMTYNTQTNTVHLTDGSRAPFVKWHSGYPRSDYCCNIYLQAYSEWESPTQQNMITSGPSQSKPRGVICEK